MKQIFMALLFAVATHDAVSQTDTGYLDLDSVAVTANRWRQPVREVPNKIVTVSAAQIAHRNPQTAADMLQQTGQVFVQKSQLGGGSPMIRGFATNRVLIVVDGVRMNNAIYRSGNLQNIISIDPLSLERAEVVFGPGSLLYGSDAIGGVMSFRTLQPRLQPTGAKGLGVDGTAVMRHSTANGEWTGHFDVALYGKRLSVLASYTASDFGDLQMGAHGPAENYLRPEYVQRVGGVDSIISNLTPRVQRFSGYRQQNFLYKVRYRISEGLDLLYAGNRARTGNAERYDRLIQYRNGRLRFAEWYYGPMVWNAHSLTATLSKPTAAYAEMRIVAGYQGYEELRNERTRNNNSRLTQSEGVDLYTLNLDARKPFTNGELFWGAELAHNGVTSIGMRKNILTGEQLPAVSRYPDGSTYTTAGVYTSYKRRLSPKTLLQGGLRYSHNWLEASFDKTFIAFPYDKAALSDGALTGNASLVYTPGRDWQINGMFSTGYRTPNIDDVGKTFESAPGNLTVPNPALRPEYASTAELGVSKSFSGRLRLELNGFYTRLAHAIVLRAAQFLGQDSVVFEGVRSQVQSLQNAANATVWGVQASLRFQVSPSISLESFANRIEGRESDDAANGHVPLRHAPPFYGSTHIHFRKWGLHAEAWAEYNGEIAPSSLAPVEAAKTEIYARDAAGKPYAPRWHTYNLRCSYVLGRHLTLTAAWENMANLRYRPYSSGIVAAGTNVVFGVKTKL